MRRLYHMSIYNKVLAVALTAVLLLGLLSSILIGDSLSAVMGQQLEKRGAEIGSHVASLSASHILVDDKYALHELIHEVKSGTEDVRYILIADHEGRILAHTFASGLPIGLKEVNRPSAKAEVKALQLDSNEGIIRDLLVPIESGSVGYVRVGVTQSYTEGVIASTLKKLAFLIGSICLIAILFAARMARLITAPISLLVKASREIAQGQFSAKGIVATRDEIGILAASFKEMAASLVQTNAEKDTLVEALREKEQLRAILLGKVISAQEDERRRISRELHDETGQALTSLVVSMRALADKATDERQRELLMGARNVAAEILKGIRDMAVELRPPVLDDLGLLAAMKKYIATFQERFDVTIKLSSASELPGVDKQIAVALYRIMQETLTNIIKHSEATIVDIDIKSEAGALIMEIADNGRGVTEDEINEAIRMNRLGIFGMKERTELLGGRFQLRSLPLEGTVITVVIPIEGEGKVHGN